MSKRINDYLNELKRSLSGADPAVVHDALSDAEEYLRNGAAQCLSEEPGLGEDAALDRVIAEYGSPPEVAAAYREIERRTPPALAPATAPDKRSAAKRFFGVFVDPRAYASIFYMLFSLATGIFYFTWVTTGLSLSVSLIVLIIGLPFFALFLLSVRGIALVEGRLVEALLGVRMPRRPKFTEKLGFWRRLKTLFTDRRSWFAMIYMVAQLPLGCLYFTVFVTMLTLGLAGIAVPVLQWVFGFPVYQSSHTVFYAPGWMAPLFAIVGVLWFLATLHLAKGLGQLHGRFAKAMLVRE
jgi:uncharacterized membrane protein